MFTVLGVLTILFAIGLFIATKFMNLRTEDQEVNGSYGRTTLKAHPKFLTNYTGKKAIMFSLIGIGLMTISGAFFINKAGTATSIQYLWGGDKAVTTQGLKMKFWGKTIPISFEIAMQDVIQEKIKDSDGNEVLVPLPNNEGIYYRKAQRREFADAI